MNSVHFTFNNFFDYKLVLEYLHKNDISCKTNMDLLQLTFDYMFTTTHYEGFIASICNCPYTVTTTNYSMKFLKDI